MEVTVLGNDEWRWSWWRYQDDGDSSLSSRNTLGNGKTTNSESQMSNGCSGMRWWLRKYWWKPGQNGLSCWGYDGLYTVSELEARSLSSRNTLGDTTHNTNKIGLSWGGGSVRWAKTMRKLWWWLVKKQSSLSSRNTLGDSNHYSTSNAMGYKIG